ncbi:MAG: phosphoribosylformylglycinamidine synthase I, partial [Campylobacter sp.]|nr:phosphoribosylformylglycinamidine synthase I [Campylobacter sp.]
MKVAIITFPGTNCEQDTAYAFNLLEVKTKIYWHTETDIK